MNDASDERLRRLFAAALVVGPDEPFVASLSVDLAHRRRRRRAGMVMLWVGAVLGLSVLLAPFAPSLTEVSSAGLSLLQLPGVAAGAVEGRAASVYAGLQLPSYLYIVLAACILPLAATAWLVRRA